MEVGEFFERINIGDYNDIKNTDKVLLDSDKESFGDYFISTFLYKIGEEYYCYMAVSNKDESRSNLLNKKFSDFEKATEYYSKLHTLGKSGNLYKIKEKMEK